MGIFNIFRSKPANAPKPSAAEAYINHLIGIFKKEPLIFPIDSEQSGMPRITALVFKDTPQTGMLTGFTYGLSLATHPQWKFGRPELCITVASDDETWAIATAFMAGRLRGQCPFTYGESIRFGEKIHPDSDMEAFFIFAPTVLKKEQYRHINVGMDYKISIAGAYPISLYELDVYEKLGLERFWKHPGFDLFNMQRRPVAL